MSLALTVKELGIAERGYWHEGEGYWLGQKAGLGRRTLRLIKAWLPDLDFITVHYLYFIATSLTSAIIFWASSTSSFKVSFMDSLFLCVSAMTESGLNTVNLSEVNTWQQVLLFMLMIMGSAIFLSSSVVYIRRMAFEKEFRTLSEREHKLERQMATLQAHGRTAESTREYNSENQIPLPFEVSSTDSSRLHIEPDSIKPSAEVAGAYKEPAGRDFTFSNLTLKERKKLGGAEFKAVVFLSWLVPIYFVTFQVLGTISLGAFIANYYSSTTRENGLNPWWVGVFNAVSAFNNNGMSLLDANMTAFGRAPFLLLSMSLLILAGNTCFPVFLRLAIWFFLKMLPRSEGWADFRQTLRFLLKHPRRCFTNLFPSHHTWWLLWIVVLLNGIDCLMFVVLNIGNQRITVLDPGYEFLNGLFQAIAVRSGGFYVVPIANCRVSLQVLYVIMMYISAFPVAITIRNSNIYEERSLGIYSLDPAYDETLISPPKKAGLWSSMTMHINNPRNQSSRLYFIQQQLRAQLAHDLWMLGLAVFLIMIIEGNQFERDPTANSVFNVIFETVSAYGTVGLSIGLPGKAYSFCGDFHAVSKLILCIVMLRGRHRGLPVAIDKAVLLPKDLTYILEAEGVQLREEQVLAARPPSSC